MQVHEAWFNTGSVEYGPEYESIVGREGAGWKVRITFSPHGDGRIAPMVGLCTERDESSLRSVDVTVAEAEALLAQSPEVTVDRYAA